MTDALVGRQLVLGLAALVAVAAALAVAALRDDGGGRAAFATAPTPSGGWYEALAAPYRVDTKAGLTACGQPARDTLVGVAHPVLPCGAKIVLSFRGREVLTQVVDRGTGRAGREIELTSRLAALLDLRGIEELRWRFAAR